MTRKRSRQGKTKSAKTDPPSETDNTRPASIDELMLRLHRRLANIQRTWQDCRKPRCRRMHRCMDASVHCIRSRPQAENSDPQETAQALHELRVMLEKGLRERQAQ